jgi:undecaprenyl-diphosphatase
MNFFDDAIISTLNQFAQRSWIVDKSIHFCAGNTLLKGCLVPALVWWAWFQVDDRQRERRSRLAATLMACIVAVFIARAMALTLPLRLRPLHSPTLDFTLPLSVEPTTLEGWSAFPSDHAVLFFGLATGLLLASRRVGLLALAYVCVVIAFARVYIGYHYPTDILGGALIGATMVGLANYAPVRDKITRPVMSWLDRHASSFYAFFFLLTFQIADVFSSAREVAAAAFVVLEKVLS